MEEVAARAAVCDRQDCRGTPGQLQMKDFS